MQPLVISIKMPSRDLEKSQLEKAVTKMAMNLACNRAELDGLQQEPKLDVTFLLAHKGDKPEFDGMRMGNYTENENTLYFESAVPEVYNHSPLAGQYVAAVMDDVFTNAKDYFAAMDVQFNAQKWRAIVEPLLADLSAPDEIRH